MTLGQFMKKYENKITTGVSKVVVSGKLSFEQDLILSKIVPKDFSNKKLQLDKIDPDDATIQSKSTLLRKEIINGTITLYTWEVIKKTFTCLELKEFMNLKVEAAIYYLDSDRVETIEELANECLADKGSYSFDNDLNAIVDTRTYKWFGYPLKDFVGPLREKRMFFKKQKDPTSQGLQQSLKLMSNTVWGNLTSPYFEIANVVCSEIVTSNVCSNKHLVDVKSVKHTFINYRWWPVFINERNTF
jgi:hypothetical protein